MGNPEDYLDDRVKMVSLKLKKVFRDLPTVKVRIKKTQERATLSLARSTTASRFRKKARKSVIR